MQYKSTKCVFYKLIF